MQQDRGVRRGPVQFPTDFRQRWRRRPAANDNAGPDDFPPLDFGLGEVSDLVVDGHCWPDETARTDTAEPADG